MHVAAFDYVAAHAVPATSVLELGGRDVNGTVRGLFPGARYVAVDIASGPGVDVVADAADLTLDECFDAVVCTEVLEHTDRAAEILRNAWRHLVHGGMLIATMAGPERLPHSAVDGGPLRPGEYYRNVTPNVLAHWLQVAGFDDFTIDSDGDDVRCVAVR